jgi:hypothetical protein
LSELLVGRDRDRCVDSYQCRNLCRRCCVRMWRVMASPPLYRRRFRTVSKRSLRVISKSGCKL